MDNNFGMRELTPCEMQETEGGIGFICDALEAVVAAIFEPIARVIAFVVLTPIFLLLGLDPTTILTGNSQQG